MGDAVPPFLTFLTPTYRRPQRLAACLASVGAQTAVHTIEHLVLPDYVGRGIGGMFATLPAYTGAIHGRYVHVLADDDVLAGPRVVEQLAQFSAERADPPVILVKVVKYADTTGGLLLPLDDHGPPVMGRIDLGCLVVRADVWTAHAHQYGHRYEGDFDFAHALWQAGHAFIHADLLFLRGAVMHGTPEAVA